VEVGLEASRLENFDIKDDTISNVSIYRGICASGANIPRFRALILPELMIASGRASVRVCFVSQPAKPARSEMELSRC
jgi:hypothetical protein